MPPERLRAMILRERTRLFAAAVMAVALWTRLPAAQTPGATAPADLDIQQVRPNFYMIARAGGNIGVQIGADGPVVIDAGTADRAPAVIAAIKKLSDQPIRYIIDTGPDA